MTQERTVEVTSAFGRPKQVTLDEYITQWKNHVGQLYNICEGDEVHAVADIVLITVDIAGKEFDRLYAKQNPEVGA